VELSENATWQAQKLLHANIGGWDSNQIFYLFVSLILDFDAILVM